MHRIIAELDEAIGRNDDRVYQRSGQLVIVRGVLAEDARRLGIAFNQDDIILAPFKRDTLLPSISEQVDYGAEVVEEKGAKPVWKPSLPTVDVTSAFLGKTFWGHIRSIRSVSKTPVPHLDGSVVDSGYDASTRTLVASNVELPEIQDRVSRERASSALDELMEPFSEFHFAGPVQRYSTAALVLTILLRPSISGNVPLFIFRAPQKDCGKSLVAKAACAIASGSVPAANSWSDEKEEQGKVLSGVAQAGLSVCLFDNVGTGQVIGGPEIDRVATCDGETAFRVLGHNEQRRLPWSTVVVFTSNRARIEGDTDRRSLVTDLTRREAQIESYRHDDLLEYVLRHRARLLGAAFTLIRGWVQAGRPIQGVKRLPSFETWSRIVPSMIKWATGDEIDVRTLVPDAQGTDADEVELNLLRAIHEYLAACLLGSITVNVLVSHVFAQDLGGSSGSTDAQREAKGALKDAIDALECTTGRGEHAVFDKRRFGKRLSSMADVFCAPYRLVRAGMHARAVSWAVTKAADPSESGVRDRPAMIVEEPSQFAIDMRELGMDV